MKIRTVINLSSLTFFIFFTPLCFGESEKIEKNSEQELGKEITEQDARLEYARLLSNLHRYDEALIELNKLLKDQPNSPTIQIEIAKLFYYQGKQKEAIELLEKIPKVEINEKTKLLMADIYLALKQYSLAESIYREQLKSYPEDDLTRFKLAEMLSWQKKYEESIQLYQQILTNRPNDIQIRRKYALVLMWMGEEEEAAEQLKRTLESSDSHK